jgi:hypothetical protein
MHHISDMLQIYLKVRDNMKTFLLLSYYKNKAKSIAHIKLHRIRKSNRVHRLLQKLIKGRKK